MEKDGFISIWLGKCNSLDDIKRYIAVEYTEDGDSIGSQFENDFGIEYFDEDFREINFLHKPSNSFLGILKGHSYFKSIVSSLVDRFGDLLDEEYNSVILLYNFDYQGKTKVIKTDDLLFRFIGSTVYDKNDY